MKKLINYLLLMVLLLSALLPVNVALASNTTLAEYIGTVRIFNNTTSTGNDVFTVFNLTTANLISGDFCWQNVTNSSMETNGGADTEYMPAPGATNAWCVYVPSIIAKGSLDYKLYLGGGQDMDGDIRYFPHQITGMTTLDDATLEPTTNNFTIEQRGFFNTTAGADMDAVIKDQALKNYVSDTSEITTGVWGTTTDFQYHNAGDANALLAINAATDGGQTFTTTRRHYITNVRLKLQETLGTTGTLVIALQATVAGVPTGVDLVSDTIDANTIAGAPGLWYQFDFTSYLLEPNTIYAIAAHSDAGDPLTNFVEWRTEQVGTYSRGTAYWPITPPTARAWDGMFEEWGFWFAEGTVSTGEHVVKTGIWDAPDSLDEYASTAQVSAGVGNGVIPAMILEKQTLVAANATVNFSNIDALVAQWDGIAGVTSRHLVLLINAASPDAVNKRAVEIQLNGDTGANYGHQTLTGENLVADADRQNALNALFEYPGGTDYPFVIPGTSIHADAFGGGTILIPHAFNTSNHKVALGYSGAAEDYVSMVVGRWASNNAITSLVFALDTGNFAADSEFILAVVDERYLEEEILLAGDNTFSFAGITQSDNDLVLIGYGRQDRVGAQDQFYLELNGDGVGANYFHQGIVGANAGATASSPNNNVSGNFPANGADANNFGAIYARFIAYNLAVNQPNCIIDTGLYDSTIGVTQTHFMRRNNVAAITQIDLTGNAGANFKADSLMSLYRIPLYTIDRQELAAPAATITFNNIPQDYEALQLTIYARSDDAIPISDTVEITINTDAVAANYDFQELTGTGAVAAGARNAASQVIMAIPADGEGANEFGGGMTTFNQYSTTVGHKHFLTSSGTNENQVILRSSRWENTAAITRIDLDPTNGANFMAGSVFELVGWMPSRLIQIEVDGDIEGSEDGFMPVQSNASDWDFLQNGSVPFLEYQEIIIGSTRQQYIEWENNATTFTDASGQGHDATPTFRILSSDPDVTAELIAFLPVSTATASNWSVSQPSDMIGPVIPPSEMFNETVDTGIPGTPFIEDVMSGVGVPAIMFYVPLLMLFLCIIGLVVGKFSLLTQLIIMSIIIFAAAGIGIPAWIGLIFLLDGLAFVLASKQFSW